MEELAIALLNGIGIQINDDGEITKIELDSVQTESKLTLWKKAKFHHASIQTRIAV